jgi:hypoxanthine phosphoribosyltransferase
LATEFEFEVPTWNDIYNMLIDLADEVRKSNFNPDILVGISRGGWLPARILSDLLDNPFITSIGVSFYVGVYETKSEPVLTQPLSISAFGKKILLVDDVVDSGKSAMLIRSHLERHGVKEIKLLSLYYKPWSVTIPDFYNKETKYWIVFPWELRETLRKLKEKCKGKNTLFLEAKSRLVRAGVSEELIELLLKDMS